MATAQLKKRRGRPTTGSALTAAERMRRMRQRRKAAGLKTVVKWVPQQDAPTAPSTSHRLLEARSLALHAVIANKIQRNRELLNVALRNIARWRARDPASPPRWLDEWQRLLAQPWSTIAAQITKPSENAARLRQSSPFAGVLTAAERKRIYELFRA